MAAGVTQSEMWGTLMLNDRSIDLFRVPVGKRVRLSDYDPAWAGTDDLKGLGTGELEGLRFGEVKERRSQRTEVVDNPPIDKKV